MLHADARAALPCPPPERTDVIHAYLADTPGMRYSCREIADGLDFGLNGVRDALRALHDERRVRALSLGRRGPTMYWVDQ